MIPDNLMIVDPDCPDLVTNCQNMVDMTGQLNYGSSEIESMEMSYDHRDCVFYQNMEQKCEKQGSNHALTEAISSEAAKLQNRVKSQQLKD